MSDAPSRGPLSARAAYALAALGGAMEFSGFAGFDLWPFAFVCFVPLVVALEGSLEERRRRRVGIGLLHGFVAFAGGYYWLVPFLDTFSGYGTAISALFGSIFYLFQALIFVLFGAIYRPLRRAGLSPMATLVIGLVALEAVTPQLFPSFHANSVHMWPWLIQSADLGGTLLVSAVLFAVNGALAEAVLAWRASRSVDAGSAAAGEEAGDDAPASSATSPIAWPKRSLAIGAAALVLNLGYGAYRVAEVDARAEAAESLDIATVQVNMGIFAKREDAAEGHRRHLEQSARLERGPAPDLIVWPESAFTRAIHERMTNVRGPVMRGLETPMLFGAISLRAGEDGRMRHYNTAFLVDGEGNVLGTYDKTYLLMFGEYLPFGETFPELYELSPNTGHFTAGSHVRPLILGDTRITTLICYEDVLPAFTRRAVQEAHPDVLVNITNDAWFGDTEEPWIHLALAKFRAVEHHRGLVRATNSGVSAIVDPVGRVIDATPVFARGELHADVPLLDEDTVFTMLGPWPGYLAWILVIGAFVRSRVVGRAQG